MAQDVVERKVLKGFSFFKNIFFNFYTNYVINFLLKYF